ncbi:MAG: M24 family metallopeptidase, partial [Alphaproteobacteria bacterium]|nr:M24 family metallopeptidase [Alphaproteobacteria bacterium]
MPFSRSEYATRIADTQSVMAARGIELLVVTNPANMAYLTGYDGWSFYVHQCVLLAVDEAEPVWIGRLMDANAAKVTTWLKPEHILGYPDRYVQSTERHPMDYVADDVRSRSWQSRSIGVEKDAYYFTARCLESLQAGLPDARFHDATGLVNWVKVIKSPAELEFMRRAARIIEKTMTTGLDAVRPGARQCDAAAAISHAQITGQAAFGGDYPSIVAMLPSGVGTSTPHLTWSDQPFRHGEATILELAGVYRRYHCPMARTVYLGTPPDAMREMNEIVLEGLQAALDTAKPGVTAEQVEAAWRAVIAKYGHEKESRIGYSTGLNYPPDWGEHTLSLRPGDTTELRPGMCIHCIPGMWMDDWGIEISECFEVTETGARPFAEVPRP